MYLGIDAGSYATKAVLIRADGSVAGKALAPSGIDFVRSYESAAHQTLESAGCPPEEIQGAAATGYGRRQVETADMIRTEISCHGRGASFHYREPVTVVDIGGQDTKIIRVGADGGLLNFIMNRKCAAGTGAFIDEMAHRIVPNGGDLERLAGESTEKAELSSFCTVFAMTEVLGMAGKGIPRADIAGAVFRAVARRIAEMDTLEGKIILTGGVVQHYPVIQEMLSEFSGAQFLVPPHPQYIGALGAALFALEAHTGGNL